MSLVLLEMLVIQRHTIHVIHYSFNLYYKVVWNYNIVEFHEIEKLVFKFNINFNGCMVGLSFNKNVVIGLLMMPTKIVNNKLTLVNCHSRLTNQYIFITLSES